MAKKVAKSFSEMASFLEDFLPDGKEVVKAVQNDLYKVGAEIIRETKSNHAWKDKTRELTNSHQVIKRGKIAVVLRARAPHAKHLYFGTKRHKVPYFGNENNMIWVSGVWAGKERTGRATGTRSTPKTAKELRWLEKSWKKKRKKAIAMVVNTLNKQTGL